MSARVELHVDAGMVGRAPRADDGRWTDEVPYGTESGLSEAIARHSQGNGRPAELLVVLESPLVQRRDLVDLPPVRGRALERLIARGAARFFRQNGHPLITAVAQTEERGAGGRAVRAIAIESTLAQAILSGAQQSGAHLTDIVTAEAGPRVSLLPTEERAHRARRGWGQIGRLAAGTVGIWVLTAAGLSGWIAWHTRTVERELRRLDEPRLALAAARRAMDSASAMVDSVAALTRERAALAAGLGEIVAALPDSMLLTRLELDLSGNGSLEGRAVAAHRVGERLQSVPTLHGARLVESGGRDSTGGVAWERFSIRLGKEPPP